MYCGNSKPTQTYTNSNVGSIHRRQPVSATCSVCALHRLHVHLLPNGVLPSYRWISGPPHPTWAAGQAACTMICLVISAGLIKYLPHLVLS